MILSCRYHLVHLVEVESVAVQQAASSSCYMRHAGQRWYRGVAFQAEVELGGASEAMAVEGAVGVGWASGAYLGGCKAASVA